MNQKITACALSVSLTLNVIAAAAVCAFAVFAGGKKTALFNFPAPREGEAASALIISMPQSGGRKIEWGAAALTLKKGDTCRLQLSAFINGAQINVSGKTLYDHKIIAVEQIGYGISVTALAAGECALQVFSEDGINNLAFIQVIE